MALAGPATAPTVVDRRRLELADARVAGSKQPYHTAEGKPPRDAERLLARCTERSRALARAALESVLDDLREQGHDVTGCGLLTASGRPLPEDVHQILASHALIHAAEGEMYRDVLVRAGDHFSLRVTRLRERDLLAHAEKATGKTVSELQRLVSELGRPLGPPWRQDEKFAALAAWVVLAGSA